MCIQTGIWNCTASHRNKVKRTLSKCVLSKSNRWAVVNCNVMANSFDAVCIIRIYMFLMSTWARFCFVVLFFHDFQWIQKTKWNKYGRWPIENKKKNKIATKMFTWCSHRTEQMDVLRTMNFQANGTDNTIYKKTHYSARTAICREKNRRKKWQWTKKMHK